jgi:RNA polymerase sigma-70 factor (ECF subfamily)
MSGVTGPDTSTTLLRRLRQDPADQAAWGEFVHRYGRMIFHWARRWGLQEVDAEDVTQNVLVELSRQMRTFVYDPTGRFRGWLKTLAYRTWCHFSQNHSRPASSGGEAILSFLRSPSSSEDFLQQLEEEGQRELMEKAMDRVRQRVKPHTWEAFRMMALDGLSGAEVAERLGMKPGAVFVARSKVQKMIQEEVHRLDGDGSD